MKVIPRFRFSLKIKFKPTKKRVISKMINDSRSPVEVQKNTDGMKKGKSKGVVILFLDNPD
jgi:hypothetical protein